ncbi:WXG100 family type VII secretion target [Micromonospora sp. DT4]|uniref:WXG100 family type VII secretion target n=1 Tax=Micromonospora sp. DT4 TaxID=3393438 RepID=UPI003CFB0E1D
MTVNPLVASAADTSPTPWAGIWICEDFDLIAQGVRSGSWIDGSLGVVSAGLDALALVSDPVGALLQYGIAWLIEHVKPLSEALDWLAGDPAEITAHAATWCNVAAALHDGAAALGVAVRADVAGWGGSASSAYRTWAGQQQQAISGLARGADTMAAITEGAAGLVAAVRLLVRDAIATCVSRLIVYAGELVATAGLATPLIAEQVTTLVASWGARIARLLRALLSSLRRLVPDIRRLGDLVDGLRQALGRLQQPNIGADGLSRVRGRGAGPRMPMTRQSVQTIAAKYGIDVSDIDVSINNRLSGVCGMTRADGSVMLCREAFRSGEDLARTLEHERFHVSELRGGRPYPTTHVEAGRHPPRPPHPQRHGGLPLAPLEDRLRADDVSMPGLEDLHQFGTRPEVFPHPRYPADTGLQQPWEFARPWTASPQFTQALSTLLGPPLSHVIHLLLREAAAGGVRPLRGERISSTQTTETGWAGRSTTHAAPPGRGCSRRRAGSVPGVGRCHVAAGRPRWA